MLARASEDPWLLTAEVLARLSHLDHAPPRLHGSQNSLVSAASKSCRAAPKRMPPTHQRRACRALCTTLGLPFQSVLPPLLSLLVP